MNPVQFITEHTEIGTSGLYISGMYKSSGGSATIINTCHFYCGSSWFESRMILGYIDRDFSSFKWVFVGEMHRNLIEVMKISFPVYYISSYVIVSSLYASVIVRALLNVVVYEAEKNS
jgi:hypothetical protein